jgi:23S rRNA G2445 N2-methylase RlmL
MPHLVVRTVRGLEALVAGEIRHLGLGRIDRIGHRELVVDAGDPGRLTELSTIDDALLLGTVVGGVGHRRADLARLVRGLDGLDIPRLLSLRAQLGGTGAPGLDVTASFVGHRTFNRYDIEDAVGAYLGRRTGRPYHSRRHGVPPPAGTCSWRVTLDGPRATVAVRIGERPVHRRDYKRRSIPGTLHPPLAAMMIRLAGVRPGQLVLDPCCGAGTLVIEGHRAVTQARFVGADRDPAALRAAEANGAERPVRWLRADAGRLPFADHTVDRIVVNPPWGQQVGGSGRLARGPDPLWRQARRVLRPGGRLVVLVPGDEAPAGFAITATHPVRVCGAAATIVVAAP